MVSLSRIPDSQQAKFGIKITKSSYHTKVWCKIYINFSTRILHTFMFRKFLNDFAFLIRLIALP